MKYKIVTANNLLSLEGNEALESRTLENRVNRSLVDGWKLYGAPYHFIEDGKTIHAQAMIMESSK